MDLDSEQRKTQVLEPRMDTDGHGWRSVAGWMDTNSEQQKITPLGSVDKDQFPI